MNEKIERLAKVAWDAYKRTVGGGTFNGDPIPEWEWDVMVADETKQKIVAGWREAARGVALVHDMDRIKEFTNAGWAGVLGNGGIVDRRVHPEAIPIQANKLLGVPEPQKAK